MRGSTTQTPASSADDLADVYAGTQELPRTDSPYAVGRSPLGHQKTRAISESVHHSGVKHDRSAMAEATIAATCLEQGDYATALIHCKRAQALAPNASSALLLEGRIYEAQGDLKSALSTYTSVLERSPDSVQALRLSAGVMRRLGLFDEPEFLLRRALAHSPLDAACALDIVDLLLSRNDPKAAESVLETFIGAGQVTEPSLFNELGRCREALKKVSAAEDAYRAAIELDANHGPAHTNLAVLHRRRGEYSIALCHARKAVEVCPTVAEIWSNYGQLLQDVGRLQEAIECFEKAVAIDPEHDAAHSNLIFALNYSVHPLQERALTEAQAFGARIERRARRAALAPSAHLPSRSGPLRIGFVSGDLRSHPVGFFVVPVLKALSAQGAETHVYSNSLVEDELTAQARDAATRYTIINRWSDRQAANHIENDQLDWLIDLSGHTALNRLGVFAYRPARTQATWLGYFATTGLKKIDYIICDRYVLPQENARWFTEKPLYLPGHYLPYTPPERPNEPCPELSTDKTTFNFGCFNNLSKVNDRVIEVWSDILLRATNSQLIVVARPFADTQITHQFKKKFGTHGVPSRQLVTLPPVDRQGYLAMHNQIDLVLDTFPYPGGTTSADAWWMGVPVVSMAEDTFLARNAQTIGAGMGVNHCWANGRDEYIESALAHYGRGKLSLAQRKDVQDLVENKPMLDIDAFARNFMKLLNENTKPA